ncbi:gamma-aminobutyric acid type B receptor subunit 2-like [Dysidea avara]|uniref:gamma-aminobutyric acid type B receptor subunit 2-like n=1 Tax=Dysidea avara TaxID=196820 RepID=UPI003318B45A
MLQKTLALPLMLAWLLSSGSYGTTLRTSTHSLTTLRVLGRLFPHRGSTLWDGEYVIPAVRLATDEINRNDSILPGYKLELIEANSGCARDTGGVREFARNALHSEHPQPVAILGAGCSSSTIPVASIAGRDNIRLPQLSYGANAHSLSFTSSYPYLYRTGPTDESTSRAIVSLVKKFKWKRYGIHNAAANTILNENAIVTLRLGMQHHINGSKEVYFGGTSQDAGSYEDQISFREDIHSASMRIGVMYGIRGFVGKIMCYLYHHKLTYPYVIWILSNHQGDWYNTATNDCTVEEIRQATHGIIHVNYQIRTSSDDDVIDVTGKTFREYYNSYVNESREYASEKGDNFSSSLLNRWDAVAYDSMWMLGLALHKAEEKLSEFNSSLANFSSGNSNISKTIVQELSKINFAGASGNVSFDEGHKRPFTITIEQVQNGMLKSIGLYHPSNDSSVLDNPPSDMFMTQVILAQRWAGILMLVLLVIGFLWNSFSLLVNLRYQNFSSIKASSPQLNYMIFAGNNLLVLSGVFLVVKAIAEHDMVTVSTLCQTTQWTYNLGLLLVLNTTLLKSWRIYRIFQSFRRNPGKLITDNAFIAISIGWIFINTSYHLVFTFFSRWDVTREKLFPVEDQFREKVVYCLPSNLIGLLYIPHFVISFILCFLAFLIRKVYRKHFNDAKHKQFNDAKSIAVFFCTIIPIATVCVTISKLLSQKVYNMATTSLILECTAVCCTVYMCQLTLFVPKMLPVFRHLYCHR